MSLEELYSDSNVERGNNYFLSTKSHERFNYALALELYHYILDNSSSKDLLQLVYKLERLSPEEERALNDIKDGKTKMIKQSGEEFLKEVDDMINED